MTPPQDQFDIAAISSEGFEPEDIEAIQHEALKHGITFNEACNRLVRERAKQVAQASKGRLNPIARLFRFATVH